MSVPKSDTSANDNWFKCRAKFVRDNLETYAIAGSCSTEDFETLAYGKRRSPVRRTNNERPVDFLKHITISRDQTKWQKTSDEQQQLRALLEKKPDNFLEEVDGTFHPDNSQGGSFGDQSSHDLHNTENLSSTQLITEWSKFVEDFTAFPIGSVPNRSRGSSVILSIESRRRFSTSSSDTDYFEVNNSDKSLTSAETKKIGNYYSQHFSSSNGASSNYSSDSSLVMSSSKNSEREVAEDRSPVKGTGQRVTTYDTSHEIPVRSGESASRSIRPGPDLARPSRTRYATHKKSRSSTFAEDTLPTHGDAITSDQEPLPPLEEERIAGRIEELTTELEALRAQLGKTPNVALSPSQSSTRSTLWTTIYRVKGYPYLGEPQWQQTDYGFRLKPSTPIRDILEYGERHPEILFVVIKTYVSNKLPPDDEIKTDFDVDPPQMPTRESIRFTSKDMTETIRKLIQMYPDFGTVFKDFSAHTEHDAPYLFLYYMFPEWEENVLELNEDHRWCAEKLFEYLQDTYIPRYQQIVQRFEVGMTTNEDMIYLIKPGDVVVRPGLTTTAFMATSWPVSLGTYFETKDGNSSNKPDGRSSRRKRKASARRSRPKPRYHSVGDNNYESDENDNIVNYEMKKDGDRYELWTVKGWNWSFNGIVLTTHFETLELRAYIDTMGEANIDTLDIYPLKYASDEIKQLLLKRGQTFWRCRQRQFVGYSHANQDSHDLENANERFMIDYSTYERLHPETNAKALKVRILQRQEELEVDIMARESLPENGMINLLPSTLIGYNLRLKKWVNVEVDRIQEIDWNKKAFESLVVDDETKHLVKALISNQIQAEKSTDLMSGKGNGLIVLLHGGPGTGKTFTAETYATQNQPIYATVAEIAEKPLYRVTCGDIGTKPEDVEQYLETVLMLGKIWECVLLDEADVFLEERTLTDLKRNALVSIFLRVLEYYDGILILTSNRVGTFDQAFKSRIQLALHYENLKKPQRRKIWRNFFNRLKDVGETNVDYDDLGDHIDELAEVEMNGRQIRNAITTARQLAQFDGDKFSYKQLQHVMKVAGKFETYLKEVKGLTDDQIAREDGTR
ncbi:hypothetical protein F4808DRAFT_472922 [Astrocystis sublimbata]|nr:hypothetical protein F4808DRAFT_472922 [Astrocystis sublimbata]